VLFSRISSPLLFLLISISVMQLKNQEGHNVTKFALWLSIFCGLAVLLPRSPLGIYILYSPYVNIFVYPVVYLGLLTSLALFSIVLLKSGKNVINFVPKKGTYKLTCSMGMVSPVIIKVK